MECVVKVLVLLVLLCRFRETLAVEDQWRTAVVVDVDSKGRTG